MPLLTNRHTSLSLFPLALFAPLLALMLLAGCSKTASTGGASGAAGAPDPAQIAAGKTVFASNNCTRCHAIDGQGGGRAPDLTHVGSDPQHTAQWLSDYVKNPKAQDPNSRMPPFGGKISDTDLTALGVYLASLK